jgi:hypothetical protein
MFGLRPTRQRIALAGLLLAAENRNVTAEPPTTKPSTLDAMTFREQRGFSAACLDGCRKQNYENWRSAGPQMSRSPEPEEEGPMAPIAGTLSRRLAWSMTFILMLSALVWPAFYNGFPLVFYDTGGYLARPFEQTLEIGRSALYGAFLALGAKLDFWPNIMAQAALAVWLLVLTLRAHGLGNRPALASSSRSRLPFSPPYPGLPRS